MEAQGVSGFALNHNLDAAAISRCLHGKLGDHRGWKFRLKDPSRIRRKQKMAAIEAKKSEAPPLVQVEPQPVRTPEEERIARRREELRGYYERLTRLVGLYAEQPELRPARFDAEKDMRALKMACEAEGIEWKNLTDARTEAEKVSDAIDRLIRTQSDLFALQDHEIEAIERGMNDAAEMARRYRDQTVIARQNAPPEDKPGPKATAEAATIWINRLRRLQKIRTLAKIPCPSEYGHADTESFPWRSTQAIRFMLYVGRSDITDSSNETNVFRIARHHAKMSVDLYMARTGACFHATGVLEKGRVYPDGGSKLPFDGIGYVGAMLMYPPRHSKTTFLTYWLADEINHNHRVQCGYVHAKEDEAYALQKHVNQLYRMDNDYGRRNLSLYPATLTSYDNNSSSLRVRVDDPPKNPNLISRGVWSQVQGNNFDILILDDVVSRDDAESEAERNRKKRHVRSVWLSRFQGSGGFVVFSGYPYHHDDLMWDYHQQARRSAATGGREGIVLRLSKMAVGGPSSSPPYRPIWPELYPARVLRSRYRTINDSAIWAANWMLEPITDEMRIVKRLRLYDESDPAHAVWMASAMMHLSVDPAFTNTENSDKAGLVLVGIGDLRHTSDEGGRITSSSRRVIRLVDFTEMNATQGELSDVIASIASSRRIDLVHYEEVGGTTALGELLEGIHGITTAVGHKPGPRGKERRLRQVAPLIEDGAAGLRACVEFPASRNSDGDLVLNPMYRPLHEYIVNFRVASGFHGLDALTQILKYLSPEVGVGEGEVTRQVEAHKEKNRIARFLEEAKYPWEDSKKDEYDRVDAMFDFVGGRARW